ncbi:biotin-dependent carboxyltransferase family protein [Pseudoxanthomonas sp. UTMC 1351]|uniref:biotin-dependent carboxyltransferase family protein n=1 Tax=Pseudoxanthomonas sp. UTMC 1351 TaxID=2695853 RepID=UPI0034CE1364
MTSWDVLSPGLQTTVQDLGRDGWRHLGIARAGALDPLALTLANRLVSNEDESAALEITLHGPTLRLHAPARVALTGAAIEAHWNGIALPTGRPLVLPPGDLKLGGMRHGARSWLAVAGGFEVPVIMGSRSTDLRGCFGGLDGRALRAGDRLAVGNSVTPAVDAPWIAKWWIDERNTWQDLPIRFVASSHSNASALAAQSWTASVRCDRQGLRLEGPALPCSEGNGVSEPVAVGTVQLPPDGQPIVLLADAQTVGGYARLGYVASCDLPRLAQLRPGTKVHFIAITMEEAHRLAQEQRQQHARTAIAIRQRLQQDFGA